MQKTWQNLKIRDLKIKEGEERDAEEKDEHETDIEDTRNELSDQFDNTETNDLKLESKKQNLIKTVMTRKT